MKALHPPIPIDPHCLVALFFLYSRDVVKQLLGCVAVRAEEADAITPCNHLDQDIAEQVGLS